MAASSVFTRGPYIACLALVAAFIYQIGIKANSEFWSSRTVTPLNNAGCYKIEGLEGCEDQFIDHTSGISYLACTDLTQRHLWLPAGTMLNTTGVSFKQTGIYRLDTKTRKTTKLSLGGFNDLHSTHGLDAYIDRTQPDSPKVYLFLVNHRIPVEGDPAVVGADSVIELFETTLDATSARHIHTFRDETIVTPNDIVAASPTSFYVTNDHRWKVHWLRKWEQYVAQPESTVEYCRLVDDQTQCETAAHDIRHPNGIAKGPSSTFYVNSCTRGKLLVYQADDADQYYFRLEEEIKIADHRALGNLHVTPTGEVIIPAIPSLKDFFIRVAQPSHEWLSPVEVYRVSNETGQDRYFGSKYKVERIFADDGNQISTVTSATVHDGHLYLTGIADRHVLVCPLA